MTGLYLVTTRFRIGERVFLEGERIELSEAEAEQFAVFVEPVPAEAAPAEEAQ